MMTDEQFKIVALIIVIGIPMFAMVLWGISDSFFKNRRKMLESQAKLTPRRPLNMPRTPSASSSACACSSGS